MGIEPLYWFVFVGLFSPGPNVILLSTSGARFGARATWPHIAGVVIGVGIIGGDQYDFIGAAFGLGRIEQCRHVRPAAGNQDADFCLLHGEFPSRLREGPGEGLVGRSSDMPSPDPSRKRGGGLVVLTPDAWPTSRPARSRFRRCP